MSKSKESIDKTLIKYVEELSFHIQLREDLLKEIERLDDIINKLAKEIKRIRGKYENS